MNDQIENYELDMNNIPAHIAFIMDGNGRWAKKRMMPRTYGHNEGTKTIRKIALEANRLGVKAMTVYAFSTENFSRPEEEVQFIFKLPKKFFELYLKELKYFSEIEGGLLTKEEEDELGYRILEGDKEAINTIVKRNLRLVISVAKHYKDFGLDFVDLIQHGNMGLIEAAERYDVRRGYRFSTYATYWIQHYIRRGLGNEAKNIRVPVYFYEELKKYKKVKDKLTVKYKRYPTEEELAKELNISLEKLFKSFSLSSLNSSKFSNNPSFLISFIIFNPLTNYIIIKLFFSRFSITLRTSNSLFNLYISHR